MSKGEEAVRRAFEGAQDVRFEGAPESSKERLDNSGASFSEGAKFPLNDTGNARRFALYFGDMTMFVPRIGWHFWDGFRWKIDPDGISVRRFAQEIQNKILSEVSYLSLEPWQDDLLGQEEALQEECRKLSNAEGELTAEQTKRFEEIEKKLSRIKKIQQFKSKRKTTHQSFAKTSGNKGRIDAALTEATTGLCREVETLDADPLSVNTQSGVLQFSLTEASDEGMSPVASFSLAPHARQIKFKEGYQCLTKLMPVEYDPEAKCPRFLAFLERIQPDHDMRGFLQRWWGLSMTALPVQKFVFQYGMGANGKSVLSDLMVRILGDYAATLKIESITGRNRRDGASATPDLMALVGARAVRASEPEEGERLQEGMIKELTGGEIIMVRHLNSDFVELRPYFKMNISGNHKPDIRGTDDGIWRRVLLVPFDVQIPKEEQDEELIEKLYAERSGILNWLIEGLIDVLESGLQEPEKVLSATSEYRADSDPVGRFLAECCNVSGSSYDFIASRDLIDGFNLWLDQRGEGQWGQRTVSLKFKNCAGRYRDPVSGRPFSPAKRDTSGYRGIKFKVDFQRAYDEAPRNAKGVPVARSAPSAPSANTYWGDL